jgi:4-hydroxybenzoate polyprenyltransferase
LGNLLGSVLVLYPWVVAAVLIFFLLLIGRFYQLRFHQRSYYQLTLVPMVLFVLAALAGAFLVNDHQGNPLLDFVGEPWPDLLLLAGGLVLALFCFFLFRMMMGSKR